MIITVLLLTLTSICAAVPNFEANAPSDNNHIESMRGFVMYQIIDDKERYLSANLGNDNTVELGDWNSPALLRLSTANCPYPQAQTESWSAIEFPGNGGKLRHRDLVVHADTTVSGATYDFAWKFIRTGDDDGSYYVGNPYKYSNEIDWYLGSDGNGEVTLVEKDKAPKWFVRKSYFANSPARNAMIENRGEFRLYTVQNGEKLYVQNNFDGIVTVGDKSSSAKLSLSRKDCAYEKITDTEVWSALVVDGLRLHHNDYMIYVDNGNKGHTYDYAWKFVSSDRNDDSYYILNPFMYTDQVIYFLGLHSGTNEMQITARDWLTSWFVEFTHEDENQQNHQSHAMDSEFEKHHGHDLDGPSNSFEAEDAVLRSDASSNANVELDVMNGSHGINDRNAVFNNYDNNGNDLHRHGRDDFGTGSRFDQGQDGGDSMDDHGSFRSESPQFNYESTSNSMASSSSHASTSNSFGNGSGGNSRGHGSRGNSRYGSVASASSYSSSRSGGSSNHGSNGKRRKCKCQ